MERILGFLAVASLAMVTTVAHNEVTLAAPPKTAPFRLQDVRLLDGPFKEGQDIAVRYLPSLEPDRFFANIRKEAGLQPKAEHNGKRIDAEVAAGNIRSSQHPIG